MTTYTFSYPMPISVIEAQFVSATENTGDSWTWVIAKNTTVGAITANVTIGDTTINASQTVVDNINIGYKMNLFDGVNSVDLGRVLSKDTDTNIITVEHASTENFSAASPTYIRMSIVFMENAEFGHPWLLVYGEGKIKSSYVPANTVITVEYTNNTGVTKRICPSIEYLY